MIAHSLEYLQPERLGHLIAFGYGYIRSKSIDVPDCAQIVPVKVKYLKTFPNKTKNRV